MSCDARTSLSKMGLRLRTSAGGEAGADLRMVTRVALGFEIALPRRITNENSTMSPARRLPATRSRNEKLLTLAGTR